MIKAFSNLTISDNPDELLPSIDSVAPNLSLFMLCEQGAVQFSIDGQQLKAEAGDLIICNPSNVTGMYMRTPDLKGKVICVGEHLFDDALTGVLNLDSHWWDKFLYLKENPVHHLSDYQNRLFLAYFNLITIYAEDMDSPYRQRIIRLTAQSMAAEILNEMSEWDITNGDTAVPKSESSQKDRLFQRFMSMLSHSDNTEREVRAYAQQLLVTPKYLSSVCKEKSGHTALDLITEATVRNIRYYLLHTGLSVKEIAYKMGFPDVSFFCKYTKKHLGMTPLEYRKHAV